MEGEGLAGGEGLVGASAYSEAEQAFLPLEPVPCGVCLVPATPKRNGRAHQGPSRFLEVVARAGLARLESASCSQERGTCGLGRQDRRRLPRTRDNRGL